MITCCHSLSLVPPLVVPLDATRFTTRCHVLFLIFARYITYLYNDPKQYLLGIIPHIIV